MVRSQRTPALPAMALLAALEKKSAVGRACWRTAKCGGGRRGGWGKAGSSCRLHAGAAPAGWAPRAGPGRMALGVGTAASMCCLK